jgi:preprotein translocase subunit SecF
MANPTVDTSKHLIDIVKYRAWWLVLSAVLVLPGLVAMVYSSVTYSDHLPLKVGIDYTGGTILQQPIKNTHLGTMRKLA